MTDTVNAVRADCQCSDTLRGASCSFDRPRRREAALIVLRTPLGTFYELTNLLRNYAAEALQV